ncbi:MAG: hypothetical protein Kow0098_23710 [Ignavibacteriaceae bacterium]
MDKKSSGKQETLEYCPHCGFKLTPWQQVLLQVDRALVCKNCWYRIILDVSEDIDNPQIKTTPPKKEDQRN